eukprot:CAMPEP_0177781628 /NCGR_PEP_ID=MMETSP0491_2-20121128/17969_1 /TAXON_ID=63592 /ORGANISM="Tetraselmis chuii, Strain PLY429" /LENGTH=207 /DNA_ID=CAMNT_0019301741 /DNA_START=63 /DNA_END=685 /DNA_ORIENTATION=-
MGSHRTHPIFATFLQVRERTLREPRVPWPAIFRHLHHTETCAILAAPVRHREQRGVRFLVHGNLQLRHLVLQVGLRVEDLNAIVSLRAGGSLRHVVELVRWRAQRGVHIMVAWDDHRLVSVAPPAGAFLDNDGQRPYVLVGDGGWVAPHRPSHKWCATTTTASREEGTDEAPASYPALESPRRIAGPRLLAFERPPAERSVSLLGIG